MYVEVKKEIILSVGALKYSERVIVSTSNADSARF